MDKTNEGKCPKDTESEARGAQGLGMSECRWAPHAGFKAGTGLGTSWPNGLYLTFLPYALYSSWNIWALIPIEYIPYPPWGSTFHSSRSPHHAACSYYLLLTLNPPPCYVSQFRGCMDPFLPPLLDPLGISHVRLHVAALSSGTSVLHLVLRSISFYISCLLYGFTLHPLHYFPIGFNTHGFHCFVPFRPNFGIFRPLI